MSQQKIVKVLEDGTLPVQWACICVDNRSGPVRVERLEDTGGLDDRVAIQAAVDTPGHDVTMPGGVVLQKEFHFCVYGRKLLDGGWGLMMHSCGDEDAPRDPATVSNSSITAKTEQRGGEFRVLAIKSLRCAWGEWNGCSPNHNCWWECDEPCREESKYFSADIPAHAMFLLWAFNRMLNPEDEWVPYQPKSLLDFEAHELMKDVEADQDLDVARQDAQRIASAWNKLLQGADKDAL